jgi:hypothetical protein
MKKKSKGGDEDERRCFTLFLNSWDGGGAESERVVGPFS